MNRTVASIVPRQQILATFPCPVRIIKNPSFRGPEGLGKRYSPIEYQDFLKDPEARREYWRRKVGSYPLLRDARPSRGHLALARMFEAGLLKTVITQNIDSV